MTDAERAEVHVLKRAGLSLREIAKRVGYSRPTITAVLKESDPAEFQAPAHMAPPAAPDQEVDAPPADAPALDQVRFLIAQARAGLTDALAVGDSALAQRQTRNAAALMSVLARLERTAADESDAVRISSAEAKQIRAQLFERLSAHLDRPILCTECNRKLSVRWGTEGLTAPDEHDPGANAHSR
ncbi:MAG TPA: helix-turn-helix domain-containing protein [Polyangiaceae bacterium]|nr:helix-turn-helix domain-containing protein [Polyangiaceae bacterium]